MSDKDQFRLPVVPEKKLPAERAARRDLLRRAGQGDSLKAVVKEPVAPKEASFAFILDATGSMGGTIDAAKQHIQMIVQRARERTKANISVRIYAYRDYDDPRTLLLRSEKTSNAAALAAFLGTITAMGGGDHEEALEYGLRAAAEDGGYNAIFVVGDARPRTEAELRQVAPNERVAKSWAQELRSRDTKVHTLWVRTGAGTPVDQAAFAEIAQYGGGSAAVLDGSRDILDVTVLAMLERLSGARAVEKYASEFRLSDAALTFQKALMLEHKR